MSLYAASVEVGRGDHAGKAQSRRNDTFQLLLAQIGAATAFSVTARSWEGRQQLQISSQDGYGSQI